MCLGWVAARADATEVRDHVERVDAPAPGDPMVPVGREREVIGSHRPCRPDLRGLLAERAGPDPQLALSLQGGRLPVEPPHQYQVTVQVAVLPGGEVQCVFWVADAFAVRGQQLHHRHCCGGVIRPW